MAKFWYISICLVLLITPTTLAVPDIQLFIDGATYDWDTQTWVATTTGSVDLYVISANDAKADIIVSVALGHDDDPSLMTVDFGGTVINPGDWVYGSGPISNAPSQWNGSEDLPKHSVFPTWYSEVHTGAYGLGMNVGDVQPGPDFWDPSIPSGPANALGEYKIFTVDLSGPVGSSVHFDAYTLNPDGTIDKFAPFSHDATTTIVPEPGTFALMGSGLLALGFGIYRKRKRS
ncbi:MAG: choice-of-anchor N protein [Candidatus Zixiibacteriota bacterium]|nr:MAG: choice-of-anchor N protein [candidate division Zixibacteria bacterium]